MASTAAAYRNSDDSGSAKERPYFTVADIEKFFETCPPELLSRRFRHFLRHAWIAAGRPHGTNIELFTSAEKYRRACFYKSERTVRYNLRASEKLSYLEIVGEHHKWLRPRTARDRGLYRRVTTHRLSLSLLLRWRNGHHHSESAQAEITPIRKPAAPAPPPLPPAPAAPQPERSKPAAVTSRQFTTLTRREVPKFVGVFVSLMKPRPIQESPAPEPPRNLALEAQWDRIRGLLEKKIDRHSFDTWLKPTRASEEREGVLYVRVPTVEFVHVGTKFAAQIAFALRELKLPYQGLQFFAPEPRAPKFAPAMSKQEALVRACLQFGISPEHGVEVLKLHGHKVEREGGA